LLIASILEITSDHHNSAFRLIRAIVDARVIVPEIYDLMNKMIEQIALSHRKGVRESCSTVIITFIIHYPLGVKRLSGHVKQLIQNTSYDFEEGRLSSLDVIVNLCRLLPPPVLDQYAHIIFMPMTLRIVNDPSTSCRNRAADVITSLLRRTSVENANQFIDYVLCWLNINSANNFSISNRPLVRTGAQIMGLIVIARPELLKKSRMVPRIVQYLKFVLPELLSGELQKTGRLASLEKREISKGLEEQLEGGDLEDWALLYHLLLMLERFFSNMLTITDTAVMAQDEDDNSLLMETVQEAMLFPHAWVRAVACRILTLYCKRRDPLLDNFGNSSVENGTDIFLQKNGLYQFARRLCVVLNQPVLSTSIFESLLICFPFCVQAMIYHPKLDSVNLASKDDTDGSSASDDGDSDGEDDEPSETADEETSGEKPGAVSASNWLMQRLRGIGADSRGFRRLNVLKILEAIIKSCPTEFIMLHIKQLMEVALRARLTKGLPDEQINKDAKQAALELLDSLEKKIGSSTYIGLYGEIQQKIENSKAEKKRKLAADAVANPKAYAQRKVRYILIIDTVIRYTVLMY
jgi:U3 small nucleolar RNA-associated protein 20